MRTKLLVLILLGLLIVTTGCREPYGGGAGYQYLGRVTSVRYVQLDNANWTYIRVGPDIYRVVGLVNIPKLYQSYVWVNSLDNTLRVRMPLHDVVAEYGILAHEKDR